MSVRANLPGVRIDEGNIESIVQFYKLDTGSPSTQMYCPVRSAEMEDEKLQNTGNQEHVTDT